MATRAGKRRVALATAIGVLALALTAVGVAAGRTPTGPADTVARAPASSATPAPTTPAPTTTAPTTTALPASLAADVRDAVVAADTGAVLGVAVADLATGTVLGGPRADQPYYSASMVKLVVAVDVLDQRRAGGDVSAADLDRIRAALGPSDDDAMNALWSEHDGLGAVGRVAARYGLTATTPPGDSSEWGATQTSARDLAVLYDHVVNDLPAADSALLLDAMDAATPTAADGFDQGFGLLGVGASSTKQGWACCYAGQVVLHSAGILGDRYALVVLSAVPRSSGFDGARALVDAAAAAGAGVVAA